MAFRKSGLTEVSGFGPEGEGVNELGYAGENYQHGKLGGDDIDLTDTKVVERELFQLAWIR
jgi:hypothetical protein